MQRLGVAGSAVPVVSPGLGKATSGHARRALRAPEGRYRPWAKRWGRGPITLRRIPVRGASDRLVSGDGVPADGPPHATPSDLTTDNAPIVSDPLIPLNLPRINYNSMAYRPHTEWQICFLSRRPK
jgi:hypothetical protein